MINIQNELYEYKQVPGWIASLTKEEQYSWYIKIKQSLPQLKNVGDISELEKAIKDYELKNNIF